MKRRYGLKQADIPLLEIAEIDFKLLRLAMKILLPPVVWLEPSRTLELLCDKTFMAKLRRALPVSKSMLHSKFCHSSCRFHRSEVFSLIGWVAETTAIAA